MAIIIEMPKLSDTMSEGKILSWKKAEGDAVRAGEVLAEIESDKANMEMEAYDSGYVRKLLVPAGASAAVGAPIAVITAELDEDISAIPGMAPPAAPAGERQPAPGGEKRGAPTGEEWARQPAAPAPGHNGGSDAPPRGRQGAARIIASPLAFRMAAELGLDLADVGGSGPSGRIVKRDILEVARRRQGAAPSAALAAGRLDSPPAALAVNPAAAAASSALSPERAAAPARAPVAAAARQGAPFQPQPLPSLPPQAWDDVPVSSMRRIIGQRLTESKAAAPHFYLTVEVDMRRAMRARDELNRLPGVDITFNDLVVKAVAVCICRHPEINASWQGEFIRYFKSVDIGVAVALPDGLLTPVVRACHLKSLGRISIEVKDLVERAKAKRLTPDDYKGGTFTVSNLGMFGVKHFTAIINPPEACILAVSAIEEVPVVENGAVVPGHRMSLTLSSDHRVVDGALAAQFMRDLKQLLEKPVSLAL